MQKALLCQIIGFIGSAPGQLAQEIAHVRLVTAHQFAEGRRILRADGQSDEVLVLALQRCSCLDYWSRSVKRHMIR